MVLKSITNIITVCWNKLLLAKKILANKILLVYIRVEHTIIYNSKDKHKLILHHSLCILAHTV